jgi:multiple sugar transport system ATP-binding protein
LKNIAKRFGDVIAVDDVNLEIADREFVVLVGPSGCGKTTTLRMIAGLEEISDGEISIGDRVVNKLTPMERNIAMVFQSYALYPHMNVFDNMAFGLKMRKVSKEQREAQVRRAADILGIEDLLDRKPKQLSGGQRQRVALGRAIVRDPDVFLFDEPLSNLDAKLRVQMRIELKKLHERLQATVVYVTHDQVEAMTMGTIIVIMNDGVVNQMGAPMEIYNYPVNKFVGGFIGNPGMNFIDAKIISRDVNLYVDTESFQLLIPAEKQPYLQDKVGREVILGIRPEHIEDAAFPDNTAVTDSFKAVVEVVETLGAEIQLDVVSGEHGLVARVDPRTKAKRHQEISMAVNMEKIHIFDTAAPNNRIKTEDQYSAP